MGIYQQGFWSGSGGTRAARALGPYRAYVPDPLHDLSFTLTTDNAALLREAETAVSRLDDSLRSRLGQLSPLLRTSEAAASSWIEGISPGAQQIALAGLAIEEDVRGFGDAARLVANNLVVLRDIGDQWADPAPLTMTDLEAVQRRLLPDRPRLHGIRTTQNWIGGSSQNPLSAAYVPPPPEHVHRLLVDLIRFADSRTMAPLVQAALVHAQFETIHPFADGNGRVGRALISGVLTRRGWLDGAALPISLVLMTRTGDYIEGLERFRFEGRPVGAAAGAAVNAWLEVFLRATIDTAAQAHALAAEVESILGDWRDQLARAREDAGKRALPRADAAVLRILDALAQTPVMTTETAERLLGITAAAANTAFRELHQAGILTRRSDRGRALYVARDVVDLLDLAQRRLASPAFDTAVAEPSRSAPALPRGRSMQAYDSPFSEAANSIWAKTNADAGTWMPLTRHLTDTAEVAGLLWDHWLAPNVRRVISRDLPDGEVDGRVLVRWLAGVHDIGKASPGFAVKARMTRGFDDLLDRMARHGLHCPPYVVGSFQKLPPHCRIGHGLLTSWLERRYTYPRDSATTYAVPVGMHHGVPPTYGDLSDLRNRREWTGIDSPPWVAAQDEILTTMAALTGADARLAAWSGHSLSPAAQLLVSSVIVVADWLASDDLRFPHLDNSTTAVRATRARLGQDLKGPWRPLPQRADDAGLLHRRFPQIDGDASAVQREALRLAQSVGEPSMLLIESPTGSGKTEAALLAAEVLAERFGCGGVFVALPTMATSDAMFDRVHAWSQHLGATEPSTIFLAHGKARLNESYRGIARDARIRSVNAAERELGDIDDERDGAVVSSWLNGRRKGVLANIVVGTIDQVLFGGLKSRYVALRHLGLAGKVVIVDEVHAADDFMRTYLVRVLEWLGAFGTPVILLSATLPPAQRRELLAAYARGRRRSLPRTLETAGYPQITVQGDQTRVVDVPWDGDHRRLEMRRLALEDLVPFVTEFVEGGAVVVVVRNTVGDAQQTYTDLARRLGDRVTLLHSRFLASDRVLREKDLRERLGPPRAGTRRPDGLVVVGTQVLEQSLDIDADLMLTDLAPVDLMLQRAGRLHRHRRGEGEEDRPPMVRTPRLLVLGAPDPAASPDPLLDAGGVAVYGASRLLRAAAVLAPHLSGLEILLPEDVPRLVEAAYRPDLPPPPGWEAPWQSAEAAQSTLQAEQRQKADTFRLAGPTASDSLVDWLHGRAGDSGNEEAAGGHARVRDSEDGIEVIVVQQVDGVVRLLPFGTAYPGADLGHVSMDPPSEDLALAAANSTVRLPGVMTRPWNIDRTIRDMEELGRGFVGWQKSPWLAKQLILPLDRDLGVTVGGWRLRYDRDLGLVTTREETS